MPFAFLGTKLIFPPVSDADPDGLLAIGGDLSLDRLLLAYKSGVFPWYSEGEPILWFSPEPRCVLFPKDLHISTSLRKWMRSEAYRVTYNTAFDKVINSCASVKRPGQRGTWIVPEMIEAYIQMHKAGHAISVEIWNDRNELSGGLYGVKIGRYLAGESMFSLEPNTSKLALINAIQYFDPLFLDCQMHTSHLESMGAGMISRKSFLQLLSRAIRS